MLRIECMLEIIDSYLPSPEVEGKAEILKLLQVLRALHARARDKNSPLPEEIESQFLSLLWQNQILRQVETTATLLIAKKTCDDKRESLRQLAEQQALTGEDLARVSNVEKSLAAAERAFQNSLQSLHERISGE